MQSLYEEVCREKYWGQGYGIDRELPRIDRLHKGNYVILDSGSRPRQSAWDELSHIENISERSGWVFPPSDYNIKTTLIGDYVGFCSWFQGNYGHMMHDNLPYIAWLKSQVSDNCGFILLDRAINKDIIKSFDKEFYDRIYWAKLNEVVSVTGDLIVSTPDMHPCIMNINFMRHLVDWLQRKLPSPSGKRDVIYYERLRQNGVRHGRFMNADNNLEVISAINKFIRSNDVQGDLIVFSGTHKDGRRLSTKEQIEIFRSAHTIIGPHGTGLVNALWTDLQGESPINLVEFIPGPDGYSSQVQHSFNGYQTIFGGLNVSHHQILYEPESTNEEVFVNISHLNNALSEILL
jgi:hypothetical protein